MHPFTYHRPSAFDEAVQLLRADEQSKPLAGGQTLLPSLKLRLASPQTLVDLQGIRELAGIARAGDHLDIGAMERHAAVASSEEVGRAIPALAQLAGCIGDRAVRHRGTIGGSIANNDPSADYPAACLALDSVIVTNERSIAAGEFFLGLFETALVPSEIIKRVRFRIPDAAATVKFRNPASRFAMVGVFAARFGSSIRLAVTGASQAGVFRWREAEEGLSRGLSPETLKQAGFGDIEFMEDLSADAEYRANLVRVLSGRAIQAMQ